jgi:hypothetical protein
MIGSNRKAAKKKAPSQFKVIRDRTARKQGFDRLLRSSVSQDGGTIFFEYPSGARYAVQLAYVLSWYDEPHHHRKDKRWHAHKRARHVLRSRTISDGHLARIYLSDGSQYDVAWDVVLMACEPAYEHYGGLTAKGKELTKKWTKLRGPFRVK